MSEPDARLEDAATDRALTILEAKADIWAVEIDLPAMVKNIIEVGNKLNPRMPDGVRANFLSRQAGLIDAIVKQAFIEGAYRNHCDNADIILPCDVTIAPNTVFRKGCKLNTLIHGLAARARGDGQSQGETK